MELLGQVLGSIGSIGFLICYVLFIVQMFQRGATTPAIIFLVLLLCCGVGGLLAFIYGWIKNKEWGITNLMTIWTVCLVLLIIGSVLAPSTYSQFQQFRP
jgi:hypothetical protein